jgi:hypothetical protein
MPTIGNIRFSRPLSCPSFRPIPSLHTDIQDTVPEDTVSGDERPLQSLTSLVCLTLQHQTKTGGVAHPVERAQRIISPSVAFPSALSRGTGFESQHPQHLFLLPLYLGLTIQSTATIVTNTIMGDAHHSPKSAHLLRTFSLISSGYPFSKSHVTHSCCPLYSAGSRQLATTFPPVSLVPVPCDMYGTSG